MFKGKKVFITGHTGFKGAWLTLWLQQLGAIVTGYSLPSPTEPNLYTLARIHEGIHHIEGDIRDYQQLHNAIQAAKPDLIFHLAAQSLVLEGYHSPKETFDVNSGGVVNLLEAVRHTPSVKGVVVVTTDKCYDNKEWVWGYRENDRLGGNDPYSASKSMAELAAHSYRVSFFNGESTPAIATVRAGNVIGGGDFSQNRIVPDAMKALMEGKPIQVRNPASIRPWLHVLDPLHGYILLGKKLLDEGNDYAEAWNFGPQETVGVTVEQLVDKMVSGWEGGRWIQTPGESPKPEMHTLRLNWDKSSQRLNWKPQLNWEQALELTIEWYQGYLQEQDLRDLCLDQIDCYSVMSEAKRFIELKAKSSCAPGGCGCR